jgi:hypothetical protein
LSAAPSTEPRRLSLLEHRPVFAVAVFACISVSLAAALWKPAPPDMAFLLYAARRVLDGATLYRDVVEINPPLVIWFNLPIALLAKITHISEFVLYRLTVAALVGGLFGLCYRIVRWYVLPDEPGLGRWLLLLLCFALFPLAAEDFGQREHFLLALLAPYLLLVAARLRGTTPPRSEALWIGVLAGVALALKPHFVLAWLAIEGFQLVRGRWQVRPELAGVLGFLTVYGIAVAALTPQFFTMAATLGPSYLRYLHEPAYRLVLLAPGAPLVFLVLLTAVVLRRFSRDPQLWALLAAAIAGCYLAGLAQQKGLRYHFYPSFGLALVLLGLIAVDAPRAAARLSQRLYGRVAQVLVATIILVVFGARLIDAAGGGPAERRQRLELDDLVGFVREHAAGRPIAVLSYHIASAFPLVNYAGVPLASRFPHLWLLPTSYADSLDAGGALVYHAPAEMQPPERYLWDAVREDLLEGQPGLIVVLRPARDIARNGLRRLHYIRYFSRDPELAALFQRYALVAEKGEFQVYERVSGHRVGPPPSVQPGTLDVQRTQLGEVTIQVLEPDFLIGLVVFVVVWLLMVALERRGRSPAIAVAPR